MTTQAPVRTRNIWKDPRASNIKTTTRTKRATFLPPLEVPQSAAQAQAEKEADRWVAEMMFDHYNG
jgi:hypothetical protein